MNLYKFNFILIILLVIMLIGCNNDESADGVDNMTNKVKMNVTFDALDNNRVEEKVSKKLYDVEYVFNDAKYKELSSHILSDGIHGKSLLFDGYSTFVEVDEYFQPSENFTLSVWVAPRAFEYLTSNYATGILSTIDDFGGFDLGILNYGEIQFKIRTNTGLKLFITDSKIELYKWNHIGVTYDSKSIKIFNNGNLVLNERLQDAKFIKSEQSLLIGRSRQYVEREQGFDTGMFSGLIDEIEIYDFSFTEDQVQVKFNSMKSIRGLEINKYENFWLNNDILADDRYAPQYHLRAPQNWSNEFYGFFKFKGKYHVFSQQNPFGPYYNEGQRWGHHVSDDLVSWTSLTPALVPEKNGIDGTHVFSGTSILDKNGNPVIFYTGVDYSLPYIFQISIARPKDLNDPNLEEWVKSKILIAKPEGVTKNLEIRDPYIYKENGEYFMIIGSSTLDRSKGAFYSYKATDDSLENWQYLGEMYNSSSIDGDILGKFYELANLFKVYDRDKQNYKYVLMFSPIHGSLNGVYYLTGQFDRVTGKFISEDNMTKRIDIGPQSQVLAGAGFYEEESNRNLFLTMSRVGNDSRPQDRYDLGWTNVMTLIKEMYLGEDGQLRFTPIEEYENLRDQTLIQLNNSQLDFNNVNNLLRNIQGDMLEINLSITPNGAQKVGIYVKYDHDGAERTLIYFDTTTQIFYVDNSKSSLSMWNNGSGGSYVNYNKETIDFKIYVDRSMVEAYLGDFNQITVFGYPSNESAMGLKLYADKGNPYINSIEIYSMKSAYGETKKAYWESN